MEPIVRCMILCEDARPRRRARTKMDVFGVIHTVYVIDGAFPARLSFCVFVVLADGRGRGLGQIAVVREETEDIIYAREQHPYEFGDDPTMVFASTIRIPVCVFPAPGHYRVEFVYNEMVLQACTLLVRETP